jgi:hypothetical protein
MGHGTPDWWGAGPKAETYALGDMAELAARLGSVVNYDRTGDVLAIDEFSDGLATVTDDSSPGQGELYPSLVGTKGKGPSLCLHALAGAQYSAILVKYLPVYVLGGLGVEVSFAFTDTLEYFNCWVYVYDGTNLALAGVRYDFVLGKVSVWKKPGAWQVVGTPGQFYADVKVFHSLKLVINTLTWEYVRVRFCGYTYDASAYDLADEAAPGGKFLQLVVSIGQTGSNEMFAYVKNLIVTQNELL